MARVCPPGTISVADLPKYPMNSTPPLNQAACVSKAVHDAKDDVRAKLKAAMRNLRLEPGVDYVAYLRVAPKSVMTNPQQNCSCMCGCS
jgi:hypothetical protein